MLFHKNAPLNVRGGGGGGGMGGDLEAPNGKWRPQTPETLQFALWPLVGLS